MSDQQLSPESREELKRLRKSLNSRDGAKLRWKNGNRVCYPADGVDYKPIEPNGYMPDEEEREAIRQERFDRAELDYMQRDPSDKAIVRRWHRPDDELELLAHLDETGSRAVWTEAMTSFRRDALAGLLATYFNCSVQETMERELVLRWQRTSAGRWKPAEVVVISEWISDQVEQRGSLLAGFTHCAEVVRNKLSYKASKRRA